MEDLTHKVQLRDIELEKATKQLKEAIALAGEETAKCKAAKEVIKSLTAQVSRNLSLHIFWLSNASIPFEDLYLCLCLLPNLQ